MHSHALLLNLIRKFGDSYVAENRSTSFVLDLLDMKVPTFLSNSCTDPIVVLDAQQEFTVCLQGYICNNGLKKSLLHNMDTILVSSNIACRYH